MAYAFNEDKSKALPSDLFKIEEQVFTYTNLVFSSTGVAGGRKTVREEGYRFIGIVGFYQEDDDTTTVYIRPYMWEYTWDDIWVTMHNTPNKTVAKLTLHVHCLYVKK